MLVGEAVNTKAVVLMVDDSLAKAEGLMDRLQVQSLPVIDAATNEIVGKIHRDQLQDGDPERLIAMEDLQDPVVIFNNQHLFEAIKTMLDYEMGLLPVVDEQSSFLGTIQKKQLLDLLVAMLNLTGRGSVITIALSSMDFTLSEIVQLIETEGAKIMGITVEAPDADHDYYEISVKLNVKNAERIVAALQRYEYTILTETNMRTQNVDLA